ncbi:phosphatase PAP2 family protein [Mycobacterium sp. 21AC1]|uniref:phosphatase PAP2 family protein n=1 Tax=[Mycobacterium] appelbergii TaxID=2939269 RepID=UPI00293907D8|nr:phosphatase PAP2 family protein [Mycobacterium sp. 21AC1]MDV3125732.1 phosphatase PAP2 family protein [Mycobacterium sp. 21AC1]
MGTRTGWLIGTAVLAVAVYALLWIGYGAHWNWLATLDDAGLSGPYRYGAAHPTWVTVWDVFCTVLGPMAFRLVGVVIIVVALLRRRRRIAVFVLLTVVLNGIVIEAAKFLASRPRPDTALVHAASTAFPSGHALGVLASVLTLLAVAWPALRGPARGWVCVAGALIVVMIGVGRVVLNVHHPSDVLAGWALGYAYFVGVLLLVPPYPRVRAVGETPAAPGIAQ